MIDYSLIANSISFYEKLGLKRIESPWYVSKAVSDITKPTTVPDSFTLNHNDKDFRECLFRADKHDDKSWDLYLLYHYDWIYEGHFSNEDLITDMKLSKMFAECPQN